MLLITTLNTSLLLFLVWLLRRYVKKRMKKEIKNSYLSFNELIYHAAIVGSVIGSLELIYYIAQLFTEESNIINSEALILYSFKAVTNLLVTILYAILGAAITYPLYKRWAIKRNGLILIVNEVNKNEINT